MTGAEGSLTDWLAMGGHGLYVWLSYGSALLVVLWNVASVARRERRWVRDYQDRARRQQAYRPDSTAAAAATMTEVTGA